MGKAQTKENWIIMAREISWYKFGRKLKEEGYRLKETHLFVPMQAPCDQRTDIYLGWIGDVTGIFRGKVRRLAELEKQRRYN